MLENNTFQPAWASPPGDTVADILKERNLSQVEFAGKIGYTVDHTNDLLQGNLPITGEIAQRLERVLGVSATFWMNRESQYREDISRLQTEVGSSANDGWLKELPLKDMTTFGWLRPTHSTAEKVAECLRFFGLPNVTSWRETYDNVLETAAFRTSSSFNSHAGAVAAWLRRGEIESALIETKTWDSKCFQKTLPSIRTLTRKRNPGTFVSELRELCAECGVAVVIARAPTGCRASGATLFLSPTKALLLLSFRYLSDDHFWFTFFHEAAHLILHNKDDLFLEGLEMCSTKEEQEANEFAARTLIPNEFQSELSNLPLDGREVIRFARKVGVSPGIIVGQLQHLGLINRNQLNNLKTRFSWID